jgi:hypothetical protein
MQDERTRKVKKAEQRRKAAAKRRPGWLQGVLLAAVLLGVPLVVLVYQAHHSGLSIGQMLAHVLRGARRNEQTSESGDSRSGRRVTFLTPTAVGFKATDPPRTASVTVADLDRDGLQDFLVCDMLANRVGWIRQAPAGVYTEQWVGPVLPAPARVSACDVDGDGDLDLLVALMGQVFPSNDKIGSVVILENNGRQAFVAHTVLERVARVTDVRGADFDRDGDMDLVVGQFGYDDGETRWLENRGAWQFQSHLLQSLSGVIHVIPADVDQDGDQDFVSLVSQEWEEIYLFENDGRANFKPHLVWGSANEDYGSSGISLVDMNRDGLLDILYTNGDAFDYLPPRPRPWHSVQWLENKGKFSFEHRPIGRFEGTSGAAAGDVDGDGDLDVVAVSCYNFWEKPETQSIVLFENDGKMVFTRHDIAHSPTHLIAVEAADLNSDGRPDFVTGRMNVYPPFSNDGRVVLWLNQWGQSSRRGSSE